MLSMNTILRTILLVSLVLFGDSVAFPAENAALAVGHVRCEYRLNPLGIDVTSPRLSWIVSSLQRRQRQTAFQIQVASDPKMLQAHRGDLWDSGKVSSDQTLHVPYRGTALASYQRCWWSVRVWDKDDKVSAWSEIGSWSMGLLSADLWSGHWLGYSQPYSMPGELALKGTWRQTSPSPIFRKTFSLSKDIRHAALYICGLGFHEVYLNGAKVGDHILDPAFTRYDKACLYVTHDVSTLIKKGKNALGVMLGNGWYNDFSRSAWNFDQAPWRDQPKMLAQLRLEYTDGTIEFIVSDLSWRASTGPVFLDGVRQGEFYDARREMAGWNMAEFDDSGWKKPTVVSAPLGSLRAQMAPAIKVAATLPTVKLTEPRKGIFVFDIGQNIAGWARLKVAGPRGRLVQLRYGERLNADGTVDQNEIKVYIHEDAFQTDTYITKGQGPETWEPRFSYHGFRYVEVTGYPGTPTKEAIVGRVVHTDFDQTGQLSSSSDLLNQIQQSTLWSYRSNFQGFPTDCPHREKNGWLGDAHLAAEQAMYNWANGGGYTKWMLDIKDEQRESGELPGIVPTGGWGYEWGNGPAWDSAYLIIPWEMYRYYGDKEILRTHFAWFKRYVDYLTSRAENHIITFGLNDWAPAKTATPADVTSTGYYYLDAVITGKAAEILGRNADAQIYFTLADQIKKAYHKHFYKGDGVYSIGSQTALSFPLYCGLVPESERDKVVSKLIANIRSQGNHIDTGILGAKAIFNVLSENGAADIAYQMITQPSSPSYAAWTLQGATTLWEDWAGKGSRNHIMFGDVSAWLYKNLAGINLDRQIAGHEAFKKFILRPHLVSGLKWVAASYDSARGTICSKWEVQGNRLEWSVQIPANTTAMVYVPAVSASVVTESNRPARKAEGVSFIKLEEGYAIFAVESGSYRFNSTIDRATAMVDL